MLKCTHSNECLKCSNRFVEGEEAIEKLEIHNRSRKNLQMLTISRATVYKCYPYV